MEITERIDNIVLNESGIRNIKKWAKRFKTAVGYFHQDLDGVTSFLGFKYYLESYGIKTIKANMIQYGGLSYAVEKPPQGVLVWMVDFALSKPQLHLWTDHHDSQHLGAPESASTSFISSPANASHISMTISPKDIFPNSDIKIISTVDSADFASQGLTPDDIMRSAFKYDKNIPVEKNHKMMGFVVNSLILAYKNKKGFLEELVMTSKPSLISMYNNTIRLAKEYGYSPPEDIQQGQEDYNLAQKVKKKGEGKLSDIKTLKNGESVMVDNVVCQYGGGAMGMNKGMQYNRYTVFKNNPEADFLCIIWPMGLIQISKNPFKKAKSSAHLGELLLKVISKHKSKLESNMISLEYLKRTYESDIEKKGSNNSFGFTFIDLLNTFKKDQVKGIDIEKTGKWKDIISDITNKQWRNLSDKQKSILKKVSISAWDVIMSQFGGHSQISNAPNLNLLGKGYTDFMREVAMDAVKELTKLSK